MFKNRQILQGTGSAYSKSSSTNKLTNVDRGAGYDISDSFIDDTEAVSLWCYLNYQ